jgi:hypothetical protein
MCQRFLALIGLFLVGALVPLTINCQEPQDKPKDAKAVIEKTADLYRNLRSYQLERTTTIKELQGADKTPQTTRIKFLTATIGAKPVKEARTQLPLGEYFCNFTMEVDGKRDLLVTNDREGWWYSARENQYKKGSGISVLGSVGGAVFTGLHSFPFFNLEKDVIQEPRITGEAIVEVDKQPRTCHVIEGMIKNQKIEDVVAKAVNAATLGKAPEFKPTSAFGMEMLLNMLQTQANFGDGQSFSFYSPKDEVTKITLWIDKANHALVQSETSASFKKGGFKKDKTPQKEEDVQVTITDAFTVIKINEDVPRELFQFTPPADAKEIARDAEVNPK